MKKIISVIALALVLVMMFGACAPAATTATTEKTATSAPATTAPAKTEEPFVLPEYALAYDAKDVVFAPDDIIKFMNNEFKISTRKADTSIRDFADGSTEKNAPTPVILAWKDTGAKEYTLVLSTKSDLSDAVTYKTDKNEISVVNLLVGAEYFWCVKDGDKDVTPVYSFTTSADQPRTLSIEGVNNVRDVGGIPSSLAEGAMIKQGLIYRSAELEKITDAGIDTFINKLGIKTDIDLRSNDPEDPEAFPVDSLTSKGVKYVNCAITNYEKIFQKDREEQNEALRQVFSLMADPANYPIDFHCAIGTDRTGTVGYLLQALLGAEDETAYRHYYLSWFSDFGDDTDARVDSMLLLHNRLVKFESKDMTLAENTAAYLLSIGVTQEEIDSIRSIMIEYPNA